MTRFPFFKMSAAGNDFVLVDNRDGRLAFDVDLIRRVCARRTGVGSDGLVALETSGRADVRIWRITSRIESISSRWLIPPMMTRSGL